MSNFAEDYYSFYAKSIPDCRDQKLDSEQEEKRSVRLKEASDECLQILHEDFYAFVFEGAEFDVVEANKKFINVKVTECGLPSCDFTFKQDGTKNSSIYGLTPRKRRL